MADELIVSQFGQIIPKVSTQSVEPKTVTKPEEEMFTKKPKIPPAIMTEEQKKELENFKKLFEDKEIDESDSKKIVEFVKKGKTNEEKVSNMVEVAKLMKSSQIEKGAFSDELNEFGVEEGLLPSLFANKKLNLAKNRIKFMPDIILENDRVLKTDDANLSETLKDIAQKDTINVEGFSKKSIYKLFDYKNKTNCQVFFTNDKIDITKLSGYTPEPPKVNGEIEEFKQGVVGDCWLLSTLKGMSCNEKGQEIIKQSIKKNDDGSVTVTLQGAKKSYSFTPEEIDKSRTKLSHGDDDVILIELAVEKYLQENLQLRSYYDKSLDGGTGQKAWQILVPEFKSKSIHNPNIIKELNNEIKVIDNELIETDKDAKKSKEHIIIQKFQLSELKNNIAAKITFLSELSKNKQINLNENIDDLFDKFQQNSKESNVIICFIRDNNKLNVVKGHGYYLKEVTKDKVILINPWETGKSLELPRNAVIQEFSSLEFIDSK